MSEHRQKNHPVESDADLDTARSDAKQPGGPRRMAGKMELRYEEALSTHRDVILRLAAATEIKESDAADHIQRITEYTMLIARCLGWFADGEAELLSQASALHDVGKIGIPDFVLMKPGLLTSEEFEEMKNHTVVGWQLLTGSTAPLLRFAANIARSHHEKWDGSGYPDGLEGDEIPPEARIVAVGDVFDALRAQRSYKREYPIDQCFEMIQARSGEHFDPDVVEAFMLCRRELAAVDTGLNPAEAA